MTKALSVGDILELRCGDRYAYISYAGKHNWLGDAVWVTAELFPAPQQDWSRVFSRDGYFVFLAAHTVLRRKLVKKVGFSPAAMRMIPLKVRTRANRDDEGNVTSWVLTDGTHQIPKSTRDLTPEEMAMPVGVIWNLPLLCERLQAGLRPDSPTSLP